MTTPFQGGLPVYTTRYRQRGSGFFSSAKRFLMPLAKQGLHEVVGGIGDVISGKKSVKEALIDRAGNLASSGLDAAKELIAKRKRASTVDTPVPKKKRKAPPAKRRQQIGKKRNVPQKKKKILRFS